MVTRMGGQIPVETPNPAHWQNSDDKPEVSIVVNVWSLARNNLTRNTKESQTWICVFCEGIWASWNATQAICHHAGIRVS